MDIQAIVRGLTKASCRLTDTADHPDSILAAVTLLYSAFVTGSVLTPQNPKPTTNDQTSRNQSEIQNQHQDSAPWHHIQCYLEQLREAGALRGTEAVTNEARAAFFWQSFDPCAAALLTACVEDAEGQRPHARRSIPRSSQGSAAAGVASSSECWARIRRLLAELLQLAPAPVVLQSLASHLSLVSPAVGPRTALGGGGTRVTARGADVAAAVLVQRFAAPGCTGVAEMLLYLALREYEHSIPWGAGIPPAGTTEGPLPVPVGRSLYEADEALLRTLLLLPTQLSHTRQHASAPAATPARTLASSSVRTQIDTVRRGGGHRETDSGVYDGLYGTDALAALLVSVPDRAAGLLASPSSPASSSAFPGLSPPGHYDGWDWGRGQEAGPSASQSGLGDTNEPSPESPSEHSGAGEPFRRSSESSGPPAPPPPAAPRQQQQPQCEPALPLRMVDLGLLRPESFYWRMLQQLLTALTDPRVSVQAAVARLNTRFATRALSLQEVPPSPAPAPPSSVSPPSLVSGAPATQGPGSEAAAAGPDGVPGVAASDAVADLVTGDTGGLRLGHLSDGSWATLERLFASAAVQLLAALLLRLVRRGHAVTAADALLSCTTTLSAAYDTCSRGPAAGALRDGCASSLALLADNSSTAVERLLVALLDRSAAAALALTQRLVPAGGGHLEPLTAGHRAHPSEAAAGPPAVYHLRSGSGSGTSGYKNDLGLDLDLVSLEQRQRREVLFGLPPPHLAPSALAAAVEALRWLLTPTLAAHPAVSCILADALLTSLQRPPLPYDALLVLTSALPVLYPTSQPAAAAAALAAVWADAAGVQRTSVQRQAYGASALLLLLVQMDRTTVEGAPGLLTGILAGVSARLGSPLAATRRQGMRVGRALSLLLDPGSDLFGDMGDLGLGAEELWPGALPRQLVWHSPGLAPPAVSTSGTPAPAAQRADSTRSPGGPGSRQAGSGHVTPSRDGSARGRDGGGDSVPATSSGDAGGSGGSGRHGSTGGDGASVCTATDSDDDEDDVRQRATSGYDSEGDEDDDDELRPLGPPGEMEGDAEAEGWARAEPCSLQLRTLAAALRKQDEAATVLGALKRLEVVIRAAPDELGLVAPELVRSLLHCRVPEWAEEESQQQGESGSSATAAEAETSPAVQRIRCLVALLTVAPLPAGDALLPEVYSPHLDLHQRFILLDTLAAAAAELSADPRVAPRLTRGPAGQPTLERRPSPSSCNERTLSASAAPPAQITQSGAAGGSRAAGNGGVSAVRRGRTRVWAPMALRKRKEQEARGEVGAVDSGGGGGAFRNRFADVALRWAAGLLREVDRVKHGVDLLGRDHAVLGRVLSTLAAFAEAAAGSGPVVTSLAGATLELIRAPEVHSHPEPYVRRAALLAAGQVLAQLPPPAVAGALLGAAGSGAAAIRAATFGPGSAGSGSGSLAERLEWVAGWTRSVSAGDVDPHCRLMAQACVNLQADLASRCLLSLQQAASTAAPLEPLLPQVDLARTARLLTSAPGPALPGGGGADGGLGGSGGSGTGGGPVAGGLAADATRFVTDLSAW